MFGGSVEHGVDAANGAVVNITRPGHILHPGYIVRWSEQNPGGSVQMRTLGRVTTILSGPNDYFGRRFFDDQDRRIQRVDHVIVRNNGQVIGRNGSPIQGSIRDNAVQAHIPLSEYRGWSTWNSL